VFKTKKNGIKWRYCIPRGNSRWYVWYSPWIYASWRNVWRRLL